MEITVDKCPGCVYYNEIYPYKTQTVGNGPNEVDYEAKPYTSCTKPSGLNCLRESSCEMEITISAS